MNCHFQKCKLKVCRTNGSKVARYHNLRPLSALLLPKKSPKQKFCFLLLMQIVFLGKIWILSLFSAATKRIIKLSQPTFICFRRPWVGMKNVVKCLYAYFCYFIALIFQRKVVHEEKKPQRGSFCDYSTPRTLNLDQSMRKRKHTSAQFVIILKPSEMILRGTMLFLREKKTQMYN